MKDEAVLRLHPSSLRLRHPPLSLLAFVLRIALARRRIAVRENTEIRGLLIADERVRGVMCSSGAVPGDAVIIASGAWLNAFGGEAAGLPPVTPVKGQMVAVEPPAGTSLPRQLLWGKDVYLVTRGGRVLIGATVEDAGFDTSVSGEAYSRLVSAAARILPADTLHCPT